jgi:hypothetical protein
MQDCEEINMPDAVRMRPWYAVAIALILALMSVTVGLPMGTQKAQAAYSEPTPYTIGLRTPAKIRKLIYPTIGNPAIVKKGTSFTIEWDPREQNFNTMPVLPTCTDFSVLATTTNGGSGTVTRSLEVVGVPTTGPTSRWPDLPTEAIYHVEVTVPYSLPADLYDLSVSCSIDGSIYTYTDTQTNSLSVVDEFKSDPNFIQMSDIHVYGPENQDVKDPIFGWITIYGHSRTERGQRRTSYDSSPNGEGWGARYLHKEIMEINRMHPDFCVLTGDYDFGQRYFRQEEPNGFGDCTEYEYEQSWFYQEIQALEVPVFITMGNHDGYTYSQGDGAAVNGDWFAYWRHLYGPTYFTFDYGDKRFFGLSTMDWPVQQRILQNIFSTILQPVKYMGTMRNNGDVWQSGCTADRLATINVGDFTGQLGWLRDQLAASQGPEVKSRIFCMHHDPWKDDGSGSMWQSGGSGDWLSQLEGQLDMGNGPGRLALIKLATTYKVALMVHGHDHSDCSSEDDSQKALLNWTGTDGSNGQHCISQNTTSGAFQGDGNSTEYPGYRRVWIDANGKVITSGDEGMNYAEPFHSWPAYKGTNVGGTTNLGNLSIPAVQQSWIGQPGPTCEDSTCTLTSNYNKPLNGMYLEFPMKMLSGGYYYTVSNGTWGETFDVSGSVRMNQVYTSLTANQANNAVHVTKSSQPDTTPPTGSMLINGGATSTDDGNVTLTIDASDARSGVGGMKVSNDPNFIGAEWEPYKPTRAWTLSTGSGLKTVYVMLRDRAMPANTVTCTDTITYNYTPPAGPRIISCTPSEGNRGAECTIAITGADTHFTQGTPSVTVTKDGGVGMDVLGSTTVDSNTQCHVNIKPKAANPVATVGYWDIGVTGGSEQVAPLRCGFRVNGPFLTEVNPASARQGQTLTLAITGSGTHFVTGTSLAHILKNGLDASGITVNSCTRQDDTHCTVNITVSNACPIGAYDVRVTTGVEVADIEGGLTVTAVQPRILRVSPQSGARGQSMNVQINAADTHFVQGRSAASFSGSGITVHSTAVSTPTRATANITISSGATVDTRDVSVTTPGEQTRSLADGFAVEWPAPTVTSITPSAGVDNGEVSITNLAGNNFLNTPPPVVTLSKLGQPDILATAVVWVSASKLTCKFNLNSKATGKWDLTVTNKNGKSDMLEDGFTVENPAPTIASITPNNALNTGTFDITNLAGTGFLAGATVKLKKTGQADLLPVGSSTVVVSATQITCQFDLTGKQGGPWDVVVTNTDGKFATLANGFTVMYAVAPQPTGINPATGESGDVVHGATVAGSDFMSGAVVKLKKGTTEIVASGVDVLSDTQITCDIDLSGAVSGYWDVIVANADGQFNTLHSAFTVTRAVAPTLTSISPTYGSVGTTVTLTGTSFGASKVANSHVYFNGTESLGSNIVSWSDTEIKAKVPAGATSGPVTVWTNAGGSAGKDFTVTNPVPPKSEPTPVWYLAEGTSDYGFETYLTIENPNNQAVTAMVTYMTKAGPRTRAALTLPGLSQTVINPRNDIGSMDFSTKVECKEGKSIYVDRRMTWTGPGAPSSEGHSSVGVAAPAKTWYLPEGSSKWGFETWLLVQNPNSSTANVTLTYMIEGKGPTQRKHSVPANSRASFNMGTDIGAADASIKVASNVPVIPERAMYRNNRREGHDSIGTTTPAKDYYLAEGTTDWGFTTYVLVQNPNASKASVTITYMTPTGPVAQKPFTMDPNSRKTVNVNEVVQKKDLSIHVKGSLPIIAERAMYWGAGTPLGEACHDSIGMASPHMNFYLPDGETFNRTETWTLVQNPNPVPVKIEVTYLTANGKGNKTLPDTVPANSRKSYTLGDVFPAGRAAILVKSKSAGLPIMVERSMYWNSRGAGTDTIGGFSD